MSLSGVMIVSYIRLKNVHFSYDETQVFKDLNFYLPKNKTLSIIGPAGTGKTTLLRLLNNELIYDGEIDISGVVVKKDNFIHLETTLYCWLFQHHSLPVSDRPYHPFYKNQSEKCRNHTARSGRQ